MAPMRRLVWAALATWLVTCGAVFAPGGRIAGAGDTDTSIDVADRGSVEQVDTTLPPPDTGSGRRAVFSIGQQRVWVYADDTTIIRTFLVSARLDMPNVGTYSVTSRSAYTCSSDHRTVCMRYMIRFTKGPGGDNIGFHEIPRDTALPGDPWVQTVDQLGQPLSSGCLRESTADAEFMWAWAPVGTKVVVIA